MDDEQRLEEIRERRRMRDEYQEDSFGFSEQETEKKDYLLRITCLQAMLCLLLVGAVFLMSKFTPSAFAQLRSAYQSVMQQRIPVQDMFAALRGASEYVLKPVDNWMRQAPEQTTQPQDTTQPQTTQQSDTETQTDASGGIDIPLMAGQVNASFTPVYATFAPVLPVQGVVSSRFGYRIHPITGEGGIHTGLDIAAAQGTPIAAAYNGTVEEVGESSGFGNYILLRHQDGLQTFYAHCSEVYVQEGAALRAGETVGLVGSTGQSTGPHLHFELRVDGVRCNPEWILAALLTEDSGAE